MKYRMKFQWVLLFVVVLMMACSDDEPAGPVILPECSGSESVTITTDPELSFTWAPDCRLMGWLIEPTGSGADQWLVLSEGSNSIEPPVTYGVVPDGAQEIHAAETLVSGMEYNLMLWRWVGPGLQDGEMISSTAFIR